MAHQWDDLTRLSLLPIVSWMDKRRLGKQTYEYKFTEFGVHGMFHSGEATEILELGP